MTFLESLQSFSFLRPFWFFALPLLFLVWKSKQHVGHSKQWGQYISRDFLKVLSKSETHKNHSKTSIIIIIGLFIGILALSGPSIKADQEGSFTSDNATIIIADASLSMLSTDLSPSRKKWAQLKIQEISKNLGNSLTGLIIYSGDAHVILPLTKDSKNILHLTQVIEPEILPLKGSDPESAFKLASLAFEESNISKGTIIWVTDGIEKSDIGKIKSQLGEHNLLTLVAGTTTGAPIELENGQYYKYKNEIVIPTVNTNTFDQLSKSIGHPWQWLTRDDLDIQWIKNNSNFEIDLENKYIERIDLGIYLAVFSALFLLVFLQPNAHTISIALMIIIFLPQNLYANDLWQSYDKQGFDALENQEYEQATELFENPKLKAYAHLKNNEFDQAIEILENPELELNADDYFNLGQAHAKKQNFEQALEHYNTSKSLNDSEDVNQAINTTKQLIELQQQTQTNTQDSTQTNSETSTQTSSETSTSTQTRTSTSTSTQTSTSTSQQTSTSTSTSTSTQTDTSTQTSTSTDTASQTQTSTQTDTSSEDDLDNKDKRDLDIKEDLLLLYINQFNRQIILNNRQTYSEEGPKW